MRWREQERLVSPELGNGSGDLLTLILAGGQGRRLEPLTHVRAKPVIPFAGRRLIDFTLLNCVESGVQDVVVLTQYQSGGVERHVGRWGDRFDGLRCFSSSEWGAPFRGTADAVRAALRSIHRGQLVMILAADHVYRMDYGRMFELMARTGAQGVLSTVPCSVNDAHRLGVVSIDEDGLIETFIEKPDCPVCIPGMVEACLASMGIYLFRRDALESFLLSHPEATDFGYEVVPGMLDDGHRLVAYRFGGEDDCPFWRDISDIDALHCALMELVEAGPRWAGQFLYEIDYASSRPVPARDLGVRPLGGNGGNAWIGPGSVVSGLTLSRTVLGADVSIDRNAELRDCVVFDGARVGAHARLRRAVIEEGAVIPPGAVIGYDSVADARRYAVTPGGLIVVPAQPEYRELPINRAF
jgi:glucose-1-phosphate adenylyltransferase